MAMDWRKNKGYKPVKEGKQGADLYLEVEQFEQLLKAVENGPSKHKRRDYMLIFLGFTMGLRISEAVCLTRATFRNIKSGGNPLIGRLKRASKIPCQCMACGRKWNAKLSRANTVMKCVNPACNNQVKVFKPVGRKIVEGPQEVEMTTFHPTVRKKVLEYLEEIPEDQFFLFLGNRDKKTGQRKHLSSSHAEALFSRYVLLAGLNPRLSWHSLRHGHGRMMYSVTKGDLKAVQASLGHKSIQAAQIYAGMDRSRVEEINKDISERFGSIFGS